MTESNVLSDCRKNNWLPGLRSSEEYSVGFKWHEKVIRLFWICFIFLFSVLSLRRLHFHNLFRFTIQSTQTGSWKNFYEILMPIFYSSYNFLMTNFICWFWVDVFHSIIGLCTIVHIHLILNRISISFIV